MERIITLIIFTSLLFFGGCNSSEQTIEEKDIRTQNKKDYENEPLKDSILLNYSFRDFLQKFKILKLPFIIRPKDLIDEDLRTIDQIDTIFTKEELAIYFGILEDTTNYFHLITLYPGDNYVPFLTIYNKNGALIDSRHIMGRGCAGGPCIDYYSTTSIIDKKLNILSIDSLISSECDNEYNTISGTTSLSTTYIKGKILSNGKIILGKDSLVKIKY
jgi:hypothetical protein